MVTNHICPTCATTLIYDDSLYDIKPNGRRVADPYYHCPNCDEMWECCDIEGWGKGETTGGTQ